MGSTVLYSAMQCSTVLYSTVQYSTVQCSAVLYSAVLCSVEQYSTVQCTTVYSALQCTHGVCDRLKFVQLDHQVYRARQDLKYCCVSYIVVPYTHCGALYCGALYSDHPGPLLTSSSRDMQTLYY